MSWIFFLVPRKACYAFSQERSREAPLAALCQHSDHQCQQSSLATPSVPAEKLRAVPDLPNYIYGAWPMKKQISTFSSYNLPGSLSPIYPAFTKGCLAIIFLKIEIFWFWFHSGHFFSQTLDLSFCKCQALKQRIFELLLNSASLFQVTFSDYL